SEVVSLRVDDIDSRRMVIRIRQAKGRKDRYVMLSPRLLAILREYWKASRPTQFLFPGNVPDRPITPRTVQKACRCAQEAAGLGKRVRLHTLRKAPAYYTTFRRMAYFQGNSCCPGVGFRGWRPARTASTAA